MPSLSQQMDILLATHQHAKRSPEYRELRLKYKALKKSHKELLELLSCLTESLIGANAGHYTKPSKKSRKQLRRENINVDSDADANVDAKADAVEEDISDEFVKESNTSILETPAPSLANAVSVEDRFDNLEDQILAEDEAEEEADVEDVAVVFEDELEQVVTSEISKNAVVEEEVEVEVEEEEVEVEEEEVEEEVEEVEVEEVEVEEEEEEAGVYEVEIKGVRYYTTNEKDGIVYSVTEDDDVGDEIGKFVKGKLVLN